MTTTLVADDAERALREHVAALPPERALAVRSLSHAWMGGGGTIAVGRLAVRLTASRGGAPFTAATLRTDRGELEIGRAVVQAHGVSPEEWLHWSDDLAELRPNGFDAMAKYSAIRLDGLGDANLARLVGALRDLARLLQR